MLRNIIFSFIFFWFAACHVKYTEKIIARDEIQILNITLDKIVGSDTIYRYSFRRNPPPKYLKAFSNDIDSVQYKKVHHFGDSVQKILDTATLFLVVYPHNDNFVDAWIEKIEQKIKEKKTDTLFNDVLQTFCNQNLSNGTINSSTLKTRFNYKIIDSITPYERLKKIGSIRFSKISFNSSKTKACVSSDFSCGEFCSICDINFFIKQNDKWIFVEKLELWNTSYSN